MAIAANTCYRGEPPVLTERSQQNKTHTKCLGLDTWEIRKIVCPSSLRLATLVLLHIDPFSKVQFLCYCHTDDSSSSYIGSGFGVAAGIFALFFFGEVPKVRKDILTHLPVIGDYFVHEIPPEDNPF